jgi:2-iminobutanoate/2-iminopropanoate deaminase
MKRTVLFTLLILVISVGLAQTSGKQIITSDKAPKISGPYSQAILTGNTLYLSGQIAIIPETGKMDTMDIRSEVRRVLGNIGIVLSAAGMSYNNVVKTTIFTTDMRNYLIINSIYGEFFKEKFPARETIQVEALPGKAHIEISAVAVK